MTLESCPYLSLRQGAPVLHHSHHLDPPLSVSPTVASLSLGTSYSPDPLLHMHVPPLSKSVNSFDPARNAPMRVCTGLTAPPPIHVPISHKAFTAASQNWDTEHTHTAPFTRGTSPSCPLATLSPVSQTMCVQRPSANPRTLQGREVRTPERYGW